MQITILVALLVTQSLTVLAVNCNACQVFGNKRFVKKRYEKHKKTHTILKSAITQTEVLHSRMNTVQFRLRVREAFLLTQT